MKMRKTPRVYNKQIIHSERGKEIGYLNLVDYMCGNATPHIEFHLDEEFRNKGIMSLELPKYLKRCKKYNFTKFIAVVKIDNIASQKILEKNRFIKVSTVGDNISFIIDMNCTKELIEKMINKVIEWGDK